MTSEEIASVVNALEEVSKAQDHYRIAVENCSQASRHKTTCLNELNEAQKRYDALTAGVKKAAPLDSDWARSVGKLREGVKAPNITVKDAEQRN